MDCLTGFCQHCRRFIDVTPIFFKETEKEEESSAMSDPDVWDRPNSLYWDRLNSLCWGRPNRSIGTDLTPSVGTDLTLSIGTDLTPSIGTDLTPSIGIDLIPSNSIYWDTPYSLQLPLLGKPDSLCWDRPNSL